MDGQELDGTNTVMNKSSMSNGTRDVFLVFLPAVKHNWKIYVLLTTQALSHFSPIYMLKGGRKITLTAPLGLTGSKTKPEKKIGDFINRAICKKIVKKSEEWKCSWYTHTWMGNMHRIKKWFWQNSQQNRCQLLPCQNRLMPCIQMCLSAPWSHLHLSHCRDSLDRVYYFTHLSVNTQRQTDWAPPGRPHATCFFFFFHKHPLYLWLYALYPLCLSRIMHDSSSNTPKMTNITRAHCCARLVNSANSCGALSYYANSGAHVELFILW